jgi:serine/threonine protein kinase
VLASRNEHRCILRSHIPSGVAHRDIKPQNLLLGENRILKIADFGLAASFNPDPALHESCRGLRRTMCGSPLYMAPELLVLRSGDVYNALATDAWSCGAVLAAMLMDHPPFPATSLPELVQMTSYARGLKLPESMAREQKMLLRALLAVDPARRLTLTEVRSHPWFRAQLPAALVRACPLPCWPLVPPACVYLMACVSRTPRDRRL